MSVQPGTTGRLATVEVLGAVVAVGAAAVVVGAAAVVVGAAAVVVGACVVTEATVVAGVAVSELPLHPETTNENVRTTAYFVTV